MGDRASPKILKQLTMEYDIHSDVSTWVEAMEMLKIVQEYFNSGAWLNCLTIRKTRNV